VSQADVCESGYRVPQSVIVTNHAISAFRNRFPVLRSADYADLVKLICREVSDAFRAGRVAKTHPRWLVSNESSPRRSGQKRRGRRGKRGKIAGASSRCVWTLDQTRAYVITMRETEERKLGVTVITTLAAPQP
jgi:hypothetical protein